MTEQIVQAPMTLVVEGKYRILSKIGEGSFGKIFQGVNSHTDETVAIKIEKSSDSSLLKNEAKIYKLLELNFKFLYLNSEAISISTSIVVNSSNQYFATKHE